MDRYTLVKSLIGVVVYTERVGNSIRIISARKATKYEVKRYDQNINTDWKQLAAMADKDIDISDIGEIGEDFFRQADIGVPPKKAVTMRLDSDEIEFFKPQEQGYQTRINKLLRSYMDVQLHHVDHK